MHAEVGLMTQKPRMIRIALDLDEKMLNELNTLIGMLNQVHEPAKVNRSDFIRAAIQAHILKEKQKLDSMVEFGRLLKRFKKET